MHTTKNTTTKTRESRSKERHYTELVIRVFDDGSRTREAAAWIEDESGRRRLEGAAAKKQLAGDWPALFEEGRLGRR